MSRGKKMYGKSPQLSRNEEGKMVVKRKEPEKKEPPKGTQTDLQKKQAAAILALKQKHEKEALELEQKYESEAEVKE